MHAVIPCGDNDTGKYQILQRLLTDAWLRPYMRPRWLKVGPHRAQISDEFTNWCEQRGIEGLDSAGKTKDQQGRVENRAQLFELVLEDVLQDPNIKCNGAEMSKRKEMSCFRKQTVENKSSRGSACSATLWDFSVSIFHDKDSEHGWIVKERRTQRSVRFVLFKLCLEMVASWRMSQ